MHRLNTSAGKALWRKRRRPPLPAHRLPGVQKCRLQEVQPEAQDHRRLRPDPPPAEVRQESHRSEGEVGETHLVLELRPVRLPTEALGVALVEYEVPQEGQKPDEADGGGRGYRQGGGGVRQTRESHPQPESARDQLQDVQHPRDHFVSAPSLSDTFDGRADQRTILATSTKSDTSC